MKNCFLAIVFSVFAVSSCKKESNPFKSFVNTPIPTFGNINLSKGFSKEDNAIQNEDSVRSTINQYYQSVWEGDDLWGGFLIAKGDQIIFEGYRGFAQDHQQQPINSNTPLHIASISKTLTAMAVMKLVEAKKIKLNDEVSTYLPNFPYPGVTVLSLLTQRSGLPKYEYFIEKIQPQPIELSKKYITNQDVLNMMVRYKPESARLPNTGFMYCNTNFAMLALIVEKVTKTKFPILMKKMLFEPLGMKNSYIFQEKDTLTAAKSFYHRGPRVHPYDRLDLIYGDKNVYTTPRDLFQFSKAMFADNFLNANLMKMVFTPYSNEKAGVKNYGIGFRMKVYENGKNLIYHTGWWHGTNSVFAHLPESKVTIVAIGNKFSRQPYTALSLASLFDDYPMELSKLQAVFGKTSDSAKTEKDSVAVDDE